MQNQTSKPVLDRWASQKALWNAIIDPSVVSFYDALKQGVSEYINPLTNERYNAMTAFLEANHGEAHHIPLPCC